MLTHCTDSTSDEGGVANSSPAHIGAAAGDTPSGPGSQRACEATGNESVDEASVGELVPQWSCRAGRRGHEVAACLIVASKGR